MINIIIYLYLHSIRVLLNSWSPPSPRMIMKSRAITQLFHRFILLSIISVINDCIYTILALNIWLCSLDMFYRNFRALIFLCYESWLKRFRKRFNPFSVSYISFKVSSWSYFNVSMQILRNNSIALNQTSEEQLRMSYDIT